MSTEPNTLYNIAVAETPCHSGLLTDLYELTMAAAYFDNHIEATASFELFVRKLPHRRGYLLAAGLEQALEYLERVRFSAEDIQFLRSHRVFRNVSSDFFDYLREFRFTGDVWAMPEGTPVFADEPLLRVTGPIVEAQLVETVLLATITYQTLIATKAARLVEASQGRNVIEFGTRRAHGPNAGVLAARAAYVGGCIGTSNVEAGQRFGLPIYGTVAHSFIMAHEGEEEAFRNFARVFPENTILLLDTYDTLEAVEKFIRMGMKPVGVRLDSGNLAELSKEVRRRLDRAGLKETKILVSGDLDEFSVTRLLAQDAPVDIIAVGTALAVSKDAPALNGVYKLVEVRTNHAVAPRYTSKFSVEKSTYPGCKQVFRFYDVNGSASYDVLARENETYSDGSPLLEQVMRAGRRSQESPALEAIRRRAQHLLAKLPAPVRELSEPQPYPVRISEGLNKLLEEVRSSVLQAAK